MARPFSITFKIPKEFIRQKLKETKNYRLRERLLVLLWYADGYTCSEIANKIGRCRQTVSNYLKTYALKGLKQLFIIGRGPGRKSQLTKKQKKELKRWIGISPRDMGYTFNNWDCKRLAFHIEKVFHIKLSDEQVRRILHQMGCRLLKPRHKILQANPGLILKKNGRFRGL